MEYEIFMNFHVEVKITHSPTFGQIFVEPRLFSVSTYHIIMMQNLYHI